MEVIGSTFLKQSCFKAV